MKERPEIDIAYGHKVWVNPITESIRRTECLCLHCSKMETCKTAKKLYKICVEDNIAMAITRCKAWRD